MNDHKRIYYSPLCQTHYVSTAHPECPERLSTIVDYLNSDNRSDSWQWHEPSEVSKTWFEHAHPPEYVSQMFASLPKKDEPLRYLDPDTCWSESSGTAVCLAGGALQQAVEWVLKKKTPQTKIALCLSRPPGHHAERIVPMGFCIFSLLACAAIYTKETYNLEKVGILDFDVHHGNGTEDVLRDHPQLFFASSYQEGIFPANSIPQNETNRVCLPMPIFTQSQDFRALWEQHIFSKLASYQPQLILVSAGFDAHKNDPLAGCCLDEQDYFWLGKKIKQHACQNNAHIVINLEGGYHLDSLAKSVYAFMQGLD